MKRNTAQHNIKLATGIYQLPTGGYRVNASVNGEIKWHPFPAGTRVETMKAWRQLQQGAAHLPKLETLADIEDIRIPEHRTTARKATSQTTTFAQDVNDSYLPAIASMPTIADRTYRMNQWIAAFGHLSSHDIDPLSIGHHLEHWRKANGWSPAYLNCFRTALMHFFTVMHGKAGANPVRDVPKYHEEEKPLRLPSLEDAERAIAAAKHPTYPKKAGTKSQARLYVLLYTGWPNSVVRKLAPADLAGVIQGKRLEVTVHGRKKGKGTKPMTLPVSTIAAVALQRFDALDCYGHFSGSSLHSSLHRGCDHAGLRRFSVYKLRHLFISRIVENSGDERGASELATAPQAHEVQRKISFSLHTTSGILP